MTAPIPDEKTQRTRVALVSAIVVLAVLVSAMGAWAVFRPRPKPPTQTAITPAEETSESATATESAEASESTQAAQPATSSASPGSSASSSASGTQAAPKRAARVAFLLGNAIFVADEDGGNAKQVTQATSGDVFSLSPDGATLAVVHGAPGGLSLVDVASGIAAPVASAIELPAWAPDSSWIAYTASAAGMFSLRRANRDGTNDSLLVTPGAMPAISPDGKKVAYVKTNQPGLGDPLYVLDLTTGTSKQVPKGVGSLHWAWAADGTLYFVQAGKSQGSGVVGAADPGLASASVVARTPATSQVLFPGALYPSPDGKWVLLTQTGDDGYSRMFVMNATSGAVKSLSTRRDAYPIGWSVNSKRILYIEGNAFQDEPTSLYQIKPDGTDRFMVVGGAGL